MKIVHCCLSNFYIDGYSYQENELVAQHIKDGHDVTVIASTETFDTDRRLAYLQPGEYLGKDGARVIRLPYRRFLPHLIMRKLRIHPKVYDLLTLLQPDVILFHGTCGWELNTVARYKKSNPRVRLYVDSHEDFYNSARKWASKWLLHYCYYRVILRRSLKWIDKILCVNIASINFVNEFYGIPKDRLEFFPLGGLVFGDGEYLESRTKARALYGVSADQIVFVQSGKIDYTKKLLESLNAFAKAANPRSLFFIAGHLEDDVSEAVQTLFLRDERIRFLGWKTPNELRDLLCAADVYVQPGTQSATMQMSLCCRCTVILDDVQSHEPFMNDNGWLVGRDLSLDDAFRLAVDNADRLPLLAQSSAEVASRLLDYKSLAARLYR
jgi:1,2-diacylglycerol 3-alpha-glucosyltransferase